MIKTLAASKAAKLFATCVCPVAGTVALTVSVPQVRTAVHKATAPRAYAKPKTRVRPQARTAALQAPCPEVGPALAIQNFGPLSTMGALSFVPPELGDVERSGGNPRGGGPPSRGGPTFVDNPPTPSVVPEPRAWVQLLLGFGIVGAVMRTGRRRGQASASQVRQPEA